MTQQQRWNRYVGAINYVIEQGYWVDCIDSLDNRGEWNGNVRAIKVRNESGYETTIPLQPRKYGKLELLLMVRKKLT
jgi:hypothetical protein